MRTDIWEKDCRYYLDKVRRLRLELEEAEAIHRYFLRCKLKIPISNRLWTWTTEGDSEMFFE